MTAASGSTPLLVIMDNEGQPSYLYLVGDVIELVSENGQGWSGWLDLGFHRLSRVTLGPMIHDLLAYATGAVR